MSWMNYGGRMRSITGAQTHGYTLGRHTVWEADTRAHGVAGRHTGTRCGRRPWLLGRQHGTQDRTRTCSRETLNETHRHRHTGLQIHLAANCFYIFANEARARVCACVCVCICACVSLGCLSGHCVVVFDVMWSAEIRMRQGWRSPRGRK